MTAAPGLEIYSGQKLTPEAYKTLYPDLYFDRFLDNNIRPDGRAFGRSRPVTIGPNAVGTADASALVKIGHTTILAGLKLEIISTSEVGTSENRVSVNVELTPLCGPKSRSQEHYESTGRCSEQVMQLLKSSKALDWTRLASSHRKTAWTAYLDIYVLNLDGGLLDACLLGALASLASLRSLPKASVAEDREIHKNSRYPYHLHVMAKMPENAASNGNPAISEESPTMLGLLRQDCIPMALTCGLRRGKLIADPTAEEERLMETLLTITVNQKGQLIGLHMPGGPAEVGDAQLQDCIATANLRYKEVWALLMAALEESTQ